MLAMLDNIDTKKKRKANDEVKQKDLEKKAVRISMAMA